MELLMGLICGGLVLVVPLVALIKANRAANDVDDLKQKVQRLEGRLNEMGDQFTDTKPLGQAERPTETRQAALAKPEPKVSKTPPPLIKQAASQIAAGLAGVLLQQGDDLGTPAEPAAKPSEPAKPEKVAATAQAGMPRLPKVDDESIEMKLGTYWFVRIGVMLVLTGVGILA